MSAHPLQLDHLLARMSADPATMVVTPTPRAAAAIRRAYDQQQAAAAHQIWSPANVLSWPQFLSTLWTHLLLDGHDDRLLLNSTQEHLLWRDLITADKNTSTLTPVDSLATLSASAWSLACAYRATTRIRATATTEDTRTFANWTEELLRRCGRDRLLPPAGLEAALEEHLISGRLTPPAHPILLCGFGDLTPSQRALLSALDESNARLEYLQLVAPAPSAQTTILPDERQELRFAIRHLRAHFEANPSHTAALIVPSLDTERPGLEPLLRELLAPELEDIASDPSTTPWELTATAPLASHAAIAPLLDLARWLRGKLPLDRISSILLSPYFDSGTTLAARARFDAVHLQRLLLLRPELDLRAVHLLARDKFPELAPWLSSLQDLAHQLNTDAPKTIRTYADWSERFRDLARTAGWPGPRLLTPAEHETTLAFDAVLDLLATLDFAGKKVTYPEALDALNRQLTLTATPTVPSGARLVLLTPAEAQGLAFDAAVFLRATDSNLPAPIRPNPLLDWTLQRSFSMPGADPERTHAVASESLRHLLAATGNLLFTSAAHADSGALRPSTLPAALGIPSVPEETLLTPEAPSTTIHLELHEDTTPLPPLPSTELSGGARLLQLQAACGFLAFAELRLGGRELETQDAGFDARESGNVLHRALEHFWTEVKDQETLAKYSNEKRGQVLLKAINTAFSRKLQLHDTWDAAYIDVQKKRLLTLLTSWLDHELDRGPFTIVANESAQPVQVGPLHLSVRIDRIDRTSDGGFVYVDYKTGASARPANWQGDRPDEPQLPLYTLLADPEELRGITFAKLRPGKDMQWSGWATDPGIFPKKGSKRVELAEEVESWKHTLEQLANDFANGSTSVNPKSYAINCKRCSQRLLCRLDFAALLSQPATDEEEDAPNE